MKLNFKFAVFIPSFGRAENVVALKMLQKYNYNLDWFIVCSTDDKQLDDYKKIYKEHLLIFNKLDYIKKCDTMYFSSKPILSTPLYARNFIIEKAKELKLKYFAMIDDDISKVNYRYVDSEGKFHAVEIKDITKLFEIMCDFLECSPRLGGICPAVSSGFFGGKNGIYSIGYKRIIYQLYILKVDDIMKFHGAIMEDFIYSYKNFHKVYLSWYDCDFVAPKIGSNNGGNDYTIRPWDALFLKMQHPSSVKLIWEKRKYVQYHKFAFPKILSDIYKK